jgi:hypothetical protein
MTSRRPTVGDLPYGSIYTVAGRSSTTVSGDGGPATAAELSPVGVAVDAAGDIMTDNIASEPRPLGAVMVTVASSGTMFGRRVTAGYIYQVARLNTPQGLAADASGNLLIAAARLGKIIVVPPRDGTFYGIQMTAGHLCTVAGGGDGGDGGPATDASLSFPSAVAVDSTGNLLIANAGTDEGTIQVVAERTGTFYGQAMTTGDIYTIAGGDTGELGDGGPATAAWLSYPSSVAVDGAGNVLISDSGHERIRVVAEHTGTFYGQAMTVGDIYTIAGNGIAGFAGDGGPATAAELSYPQGLAMDSAGDLLIADGGNGRIREVAG